MDTYLEEGEHIVGYTSNIDSDSNYAWHWSFQFVIGKMV